MAAGLGLGLITVLCMVLAVGTHPFVRKVTNTYWFWLVYGIIMLTLIIVFRWGLDIRDLINYLCYHTPSPIGVDLGTMWSKALLLDMCPMTAIVIHAAIIVDPTRRGAKLFAPMATFGGMVTIFGQIILNGDPASAWTFQYIFVGVDANRAYFLIHFLNIITGLLVLLNVTKFNAKTYSLEYIVDALYFVYIGLAVYISDGVIYQNTTGVLIYDWSPAGEYHSVAKVLNCSPALTMLFGYTACIIAINIFVGLQVLFQKAKAYQIPNVHNKEWYKGLNGWYKLEPYKCKCLRRI